MLFLLTLLTLLQQERKPDMKTPIETFSNWVRNGKDDGMEKNHFESVSKMFDIIVNSKGKFSIIDAGCGNGWAVRHIGKHPNCKSSSGPFTSSNDALPLITTLPLPVSKAFFTPS